MLARSILLIGTMASIATASWFGCWAAEVNLPANPYIVLENRAKLPNWRMWGQVIGVDMDPDGESVWVFDRCGPTSCMDPIGSKINHKGNTVFKFSPDGKLSMMLGRPGVAGSGQDAFNRPSDLLVGPNGDIFVADGHGDKSNARIVKFNRDGKFIKAWGREGSAVHLLALGFTAGGLGAQRLVVGSILGFISGDGVRRDVDDLAMQEPIAGETERVDLDLGRLTGVNETDIAVRYHCFNF
jgi:hypothetical protein